MVFHCKLKFFGSILAFLMLMSVTTAWGETVEYDGIIEPFVMVEIGTPTDGIVAKVNVDRSSPVKKGEVLVELESSVEQVTLEKAKAVATFDSEVGQQQTQLALAKRVYERIKQLSAISAQDKDQAATEILLTEYRLEKARENLRLARIDLQKARRVLAQRSVKSPISGVVVERYVSPGEYVNNQPLLRLAQIDPLRVEVIVPAHLFSKISPGMTAKIIPEMSEYDQQTATVTIVDKVIDSASNTFGVRLELPNTELQMPSGLRCLVRFEIKPKVFKVKNRNSDPG